MVSRIHSTLDPILSYILGRSMPFFAQAILQLVTPINVHLSGLDVLHTIELPANSSSFTRGSIGGWKLWKVGETYVAVVMAMDRLSADAVDAGNADIFALLPIGQLHLHPLQLLPIPRPPQSGAMRRRGHHQRGRRQTNRTNKVVESHRLVQPN